MARLAVITTSVSSLLAALLPLFPHECASVLTFLVHFVDFTCFSGRHFDSGLNRLILIIPGSWLYPLAM
jgi:hypothetical protein